MWERTSTFPERDGPSPTRATEPPIRDTLPRVVLKALVRWTWTGEHWLRRGPPAFLRRDRPAWRLGGRCQGCAKCCEAPTIRTGRLLFFAPRLRATWLWWQRVVNGFELVEADRKARAFVFRCTHFDWQTRRCDSYGSRPAMCRDYPRVLLDQPWPELFEGCGFRIVAADAERQARVLAESGLTEAQQAELRDRLRLE